MIARLDSSLRWEQDKGTGKVGCGSPKEKSDGCRGVQGSFLEKVTPQAEKKKRNFRQRGWCEHM